jgi:DNA-binding CsgD family transcriptional regulator
MTGNGTYKRIYNQTFPFCYLPGGGAKTLIVVTDISHLKMQGVPQLSFIGMNGAPSYYNMYPEAEILRSNAPPADKFSKQERIILKYILQGKTTKEISNLLFRSINTVSNHRRAILRKSGCVSVNALLIKAIREGWG